MPVFGITAWALQGIFVKRDGSKQDVTSQIIKRTSSSASSKGQREFPPLFIYPEGTTTNQNVVLPFKKGAFAPGKPILMTVLKYQNDFRNPSDANGKTIGTQLSSMFALYTNVELKYLGVYVPSPDEVANPQLYADNVRRIYAKEMGVPEVDATIQDKRYYQHKT